MKSPGINRLLEFPVRYPKLTAVLIYAVVAAIYAWFTNGVLRDDAYIFFTYARNLTQTGTLSFNPGETSFGVTSIAWTGLIYLGTLLIPNPVTIAKILGVLLGAGGAVLWGNWLANRMGRSFSIVGVALAALLPNIGADRAVEGMEAALLCFVSGLLLNLMMWEGKFKYWYLGAVAGVLVLVRPEMAAVTVAVVGLVLVRNGVTAGLKTIVATVLVSAWWPIWLYDRTGSFFPTTRMGKLSVFLPEHIGITVGQFLSGSVFQHIQWGWNAFHEFAVTGISELSYVALLVGASVTAVWGIFRLPRNKSIFLAVAPLLGWLLLLMYCWSFPLLQLRYFTWLTPALAISFLASVSTLVPTRAFRYLAVALVVLCLAAQPVALKRRIESTGIQQIRRTVGEAIERDTPAAARIALEPIGEIGYYANRYIVDMGGITNAQIQPCLKGGFLDVALVWSCLQAERADYLVTYDDDSFLGRLPQAFPDRFQLVEYIPAERVRGIRYRLLKVLKP